MLKRFALIWGLIGPCAAAACDVALVLAVDVSGSVDPAEYKVQMGGLAEGLRDGAVVDALVQAEAAVALVQWTGEGRQKISVPWMRVRDLEDAASLAVAIESAPRQWSKYSTAIGEALLMAQAAFTSAPECRRRVVDISGDGVSNEGVAPDLVRDALRDAGITVNALVIETADADLVRYFRENVITGPGAFVARANGFEEYPRRIRQKLIRELSEQVSTWSPARIGRDPTVVSPVLLGAQTFR